MERQYACVHPSGGRAHADAEMIKKGRATGESRVTKDCEGAIQTGPEAKVDATVLLSIACARSLMMSVSFSVPRFSRPRK